MVGSGNDDDGGGNSGSAYIFEQQGGSWTQVEKLVASDAMAGDSFGGSVGVSGDHIVVGALCADDFGASSGKAYVFGLQAGGWTQTEILLPSDGAAASKNFGAVAIDGGTIAVGAHADSQGSRRRGLCL